MPIQYLDYLGLLSAAWRILGNWFGHTTSHMGDYTHPSTSSMDRARLTTCLAGTFSLVIILPVVAMKRQSLTSTPADAIYQSNGALRILGSVISTTIVGFTYIMGITFVVIDPDKLLNPANDAGGHAIGQLFYQVFMDRYGRGRHGVVCLEIVEPSICAV
ncbi:amino-acid permease BAT1 homolog [Physcomitrium patens]|uniref:amino-acid permease BAT1 homolog n=1 Tax=Physcomitrium patens TaxID=3218 RepID=UPI003CCCCF31